ncbi:hypothetical protein TVAG_078940 [Trichomonas vaginalis G3]|uniref:SCP domain-containing protein n=1 Tax=Trichomonas vaginalis (strain ATCC PRA-98 / G3) TaxID=412133 RepID=A2FUG1_TRIV3|nr:hypothetical protein TVAGG3_0720470 [Trichomonas vaginalis G3]EAX91456.1 hypothetical protein TVAG_078940 [Trichomonas vaginalis G3]KAI5510555.1 hypothetical protein TVAGG3_0720470 [Trichomonas vaginalis G3]|eukprot:XP_001304386.1 hypothetical protein [Trichomonas vaginalis G3]
MRSHHHKKLHKYRGDDDAQSQCENPVDSNDIFDFEPIQEKANSVTTEQQIDDSDYSRASIKESREYQLLQCINEFRLQSGFPRLKFKNSLGDYAYNIAMKLPVQYENNGQFAIMSQMYFYDFYNDEEPEELVRKWMYDSSKLQVLLATGNLGNISIVPSQQGLIVIVFIISTFSP